MPQCFQLLRDGKAVPLSSIDEEMCRHFDVPLDPVRYFSMWYDVIGYQLAMGNSWDAVRTFIDNSYSDLPILMQISDWLQANFEVRHWYEQRSHPRNL
jgi:hypothetical protein